MRARVAGEPDKLGAGRRATRAHRRRRQILVTLEPTSGLERLVKSTDRVRDLGEVFTPAETVREMLGLLPTTMWLPHPSATFLEPSCGDGNFLVAILDAKLANLISAHRSATLPAGLDHTHLPALALEALSAVYGVDISPENIQGGGPGHEFGARDRLFALLSEWFLVELGTPLLRASDWGRSAWWILERNVVVGNMLANDADGRPTGRDRMPVYEYTWQHARGLVTVARTTMAAVTDEAEERLNGPATLFGPEGPRHLYTGPAAALHTANARTTT